MRLLCWLLVIYILILFIGCSRKSVATLQRKGVHVTTKDTVLNIGTHPDSVQLQYLGCGGLYLQTKGKSMLIDPFFSNQSFLRIGKGIFAGGKIKPKPRNIAFGQQRILNGLNISSEILQQRTMAIFNAHGHYDHLMDIPYIYHHWFNKNIDVYVNQSAYNSCAGVIENNKLHDMESLMSVREDIGESINFDLSDGSILKVYPILAAHNPHAYNIKLFSGSVMYPPKNFNDPEAKTRMSNWLEGRTISFLIDVISNDSIKFRMFVQSSSAVYPDGVPPKKLLDQKPVDLAILGIASYHYSKTTFPCTYLQDLSAKYVMYIHWEDFFRNYKRKPKSVLKNDIPRFFKEVVPGCEPSKYILPAPGVMINARY